MFVINSNWQKVAIVNQNLLQYANYPDPKNALIKWNGIVQANVSWTLTPANFSADLIVWWTPINSIGENFPVDLIKTGTFATNATLGGNTPISFQAGTSQNEIDLTFRVWTLWQLTAGQSVWRNIRFFNYVNYWYNNASYTTTITPKNISYTAKLLHTNWTLTTIWTVNVISDWSTAYATTSTKLFAEISGFFSWTFTPVVAQDGDRIVVDIRINVLKVCTINTPDVFWLYPWNTCTTAQWNSSAGNHSIEISVE